MKALVLILFAVLVIILGPILTIWCLNTLFPALHIVLGLDTWFATLILSGVISGRSLDLFSQENN